ncbi:MAG: hypothetical protein O7G85_05640, partial [Planctomycetota bacterium]|nr:hypothetical protein [Planctomycetota bacterium]
MESIIARRGFIVRGVVLLVCVVLGTTLLFRATTYSAPNSPPEANSAMPSYLVFDRPDWDGDHQRDLIRSYPSGQGASEHGDSGIRRGEVLIHSYLSWGSNVQKEVIYQLRGRKPGDHFGSSVLSPGDLNFDGLDDLIISAPDHKEARRPRPGEDALSTSTGQVYIMYGRHPQAQDLARIARGKNTIPISLLRGTDYILASPSPMENERFGTQLGLVTDADEDGWPDIRIRSEVSQPDGSIRYYTTFYSGKSGKALRRVGGKGEELLWKQIPGDLNQDGVVDIDDLLNVLAALSADGDTMQDPWVDEASGIEALTLGDANGDGVTDIDDLLVTLTNYDLNQFKFMFPSMHGRDDSGIEGQARGGSCPECEFCPNYCECIIHAPFPGFHCCCDGQLMCGSFINPWETCDGGNPIPCNTGFCSMSLSCDYVQVGGTPVYLTLGYSAPSPPCGKKWRLYFSPQISVKQGLTPIVSGMLYNLPAGTLTIEGVSPSAICGDVLLEWTVFKSDGVTGVCGAIDSMTSYKFDIDVDSDNDGTGLAYQKHEAIGMTPPGLMVMTALEDSDDDLIAPDYIPDFADGIERWSSSEPQDTSGASLDPMLVTVTPRCFPMELTFTYNESDPINLPVSPPAVFSDLTPPPGTLRLWSTGVDGDRHWYPLGISSKGTYVKSGTSIEISLFGSHVYIEGINAGQTTVDVDLTIGGPSCSADDQVIVTAYDCYLDVDVDSDNDDLYALPARTLAEDAIEDDPTKLGKLIPFNDDDDDG